MQEDLVSCVKLVSLAGVYRGEANVARTDCGKFARDVVAEALREPAASLRMLASGGEIRNDDMLCERMRPGEDSITILIMSTDLANGAQSRASATDPQAS